MQENPYNLPIKSVLRKVKSSKNGLSEEEFLKRIKKNGKNQLPQKDATSAWKVFVAQFKSPLVIVILVAMFFSFLIGHWVDAFFIVFVVLVNAVVGFIQENKAEKVLSKLSKSVKFYCNVIRNGEKKEVLSEDVVVGDIIIIQEGDKIPADGRIVKIEGLTVNEASLTGEWSAVEKNISVIKNKETDLADRKNMVFMGGIVESGSGIFVVTAIGINTELGKISQLVQDEVSPKTPLQKKFFRLSQWMAFYILIIIGFFATIYILRGEDLYNVFITSIALVVSAIPEGLLPAITIVLVFAMRRLIKKKALVKKLNAIEGMGAVSVICMDKTGTLTKGEMQVSHILTTDNKLSNKLGEIKDDYNLQGLEMQTRALEIATLVNDAYVENKENEFSEWIIHGRHTDSALLRAGLQSGIDKQELEKKFKLVGKIEFDSVKKYAIRAYQTKENKIIVFVLGAPEVVIGKANRIQLLSGDDSIDSVYGKKLTSKLDDLTKKGLRVLACAWKEIDSKEFDADSLSDLSEELSLIGFIALKDPLRKNVKRSLEIAKKAGIKAVVITGDHRNTAQAIVNELGMNVSNEEILEGNYLSKISDNELKKRVKNIKIFARVSPEHKIRIVKALQSHNEVVAMVGDGVNDAPALKASDIGISVGTGTDIAKEVSDIVLLDNSFTVIMSAIEQGRLARENIKKTIIYLMADDFSELFLFFFAVVIGLPFPLYPIQILWINLVEDSFPNIALTTEEDTKGLMSEKPIRHDESLFSVAYKKFIVAVFFVTSLAASAIFYLVYKFSGDIEKARTIVFVLIAFDSLVFAYIVRSFQQSVFNKKIFSNHWLNKSVLLSFIILLVGIYVPFFQKLLKVNHIGWIEWSIIIGVSFLELLILDFFKYILLFKKTKEKLNY